MENLYRNHSNHNPILLRCGVLSPAARETPFRFEAAWITHEDSIMRGNCNVLKGLEVVRDDSIMFNRNTFGNIFRRKRRLEQLLWDRWVKYRDKNTKFLHTLMTDLGIDNFLMLSTEGRAALINVAIKKEVHEAFMIMDSFKSPGVVAFQPFFLKTYIYWHLTGMMFGGWLREPFIMAVLILS
ncbi:hypothetical protein NC651_021610 [Populus alba x Populus x berolinensis]|nr:hypothetical protein NC651_021610 [Populus alba x Populus x berolinensis]